MLEQESFFNWRTHLLMEFVPEIAAITLVVDPDGLLLEEGVQQELRARGFDLLTFSDPITFRYEYESRYRSGWDRGEALSGGLVVRLGDADLNVLPYDVLRGARRLAVGLPDLFPNLSYSVLASLVTADLNALYAAYVQHRPGRLGEPATKDFILRRVYKVAPELIEHPHDLLRTLLRLHYRDISLPPMLQSYLAVVIRQTGRFGDWPLEPIVGSKAAFLQFLQERWPNFVASIASGDVRPILREGRVKYGDADENESEPKSLEYPGPVEIPFGHGDVRVYIDNLFLEGMLHPIGGTAKLLPGHEWAAVGLQSDSKIDPIIRLRRLLELLEGGMPGADARYQEWLAFAPRWAELIVLQHQASALPPDALQAVQALQQRMDDAFTAWALARYPALYNQPAVPPVMVHHIQRALARELEQAGAGGKVAMVVMDGMSLDQWVVLRGVLARQEPSLQFEESAAFAWVPTLTSVSRQAIFAGNIPLYFPGSISRTDREPALWTQAWAEAKVAQAEIGYLKALGDTLAPVDEILTNHKLRVLGLVVDYVDRIMHGQVLGMAGMHSNVRLWAEGGFMAGLLGRLLDGGYSVLLTSDHGNIEAVGCGNPREGVLADIPGARVRVFPDEVLRGRVKERFPAALEWPSTGLPEGFVPLLAPARAAFTAEGSRIVTHGGLSVEEVIVPVMRVDRGRA